MFNPKLNPEQKAYYQTLVDSLKHSRDFGRNVCLESKDKSYQEPPTEVGYKPEGLAKKM
ncbi:MAG: hypothetical protein PHH54_06145 [Candidatus Nanoarchaeia archaeon]|nr:hypothetical protein [Candidatus Nanoarchaeia archaeon]MDD5741535.1 hypothetical protein [Candidatus Nanoarchaeia archaeon]